MSRATFITPKMRRDMSIVPADYWRALRQGFNPEKPLTLAIPLFQPVMTVNATRAELAAKRASAFLKHYTDNPPKTTNSPSARSSTGARLTATPSATSRATCRS